MNEKTFNRVEQKYLLSNEDYQALFNKIKKYIIEDVFFESKISNIYFDNEQNDLIVYSIDKPIYKDKIRLRSYITPQINDFVFLEIKSKYRGIVGKRRVKMTLKEYYNYINEGVYDSSNQIMKEIDYLIKYYHLKPTIFIGYDRLSYRLKEDKSFRITFDFNLRSRRDNLQLDKGDAGKLYFDDNQVVMEIKSLSSIPLWLIHILSELQIYPATFSKYGRIYQKERKDDVYV